MVKEDEKRMEKVAKRLNELESCNNNVKLLNEMLTHYQPGVTSDQERELMKVTQVLITHHNFVR